MCFPHLCMCCLPDNRILNVPGSWQVSLHGVDAIGLFSFQSIGHLHPQSLGTSTAVLDFLKITDCFHHLLCKFFQHLWILFIRRLELIWGVRCEVWGAFYYLLICSGIQFSPNDVCSNLPVFRSCFLIEKLRKKSWTGLLMFRLTLQHLS